MRTIKNAILKKRQRNTIHKRYSFKTFLLSTYNEANKNSANSKTNQSKKPKREELDLNSCTFLKSSRNQMYIFIE